MIEVLVEVGNGTARFGVVVRAESIRRAVGIVKAYYPGADARVVHPLDPEAFFVRDAATSAGLVKLEMPERAAG
jgi:hypothetical protein